MSPVGNLPPDDALVSPTFGTGVLRAVPYPSPYFDLSQTYFPVSIKELFQYCIYFYNTHCIVPAVVNKLAAYPITDMVFATNNDELKKKWKALYVDELNLPFELFQAGIDVSVFGNCFIGVYFPFKRYVVCDHCKAVNTFNNVEDLKVRGRKLEFKGTCPSCNLATTFEIQDKYIKNVKKIKLIRYDPMAIDIIADPVSGEKTYLWDLPTSYKDAIRRGSDRLLLERAPKIVLDAIREDKKIKLSNRNLFHMRRPSISGQSSSWGFPLVMHALKSLYYLQVLKMSQEAIAIQHIIPLWILFPQGGNGGGALPPAAGINLSKWKTQIETELKQWRKDRNHIPIMNFPVGFEQIGGEGKALLLGPEVQQEIQQIIASMAVPQEFVFGGMTWTGSSITLRMLENAFQGMRDGMQRFILFLTSLFSKYLGYEPIDIYMSELKMADDVQRQQILMNLEAAGKVSTTRLLSELNFDFREEEKLKKDEFGTKLSGYIRDSILQARAQGEASLVSLDYQIRAQKEQMIEQQAMMATQAQVGMPQVGPDGQPVEAGAAGTAGAAGADETAGVAQDPGMSQGAPQDGGMSGGQQTDPDTGFPVDPNTGMLIEPSTGFLIDIQRGVAIDPATGQEYDLQTGEPVPPQQGEAMSIQGTSLSPAQSAGSATSLQQSRMAKVGAVRRPKTANTKTAVTQKKIDQEARAEQGASGGAMPPGLKRMVTQYASALIFVDLPSQRQILADMEKETPTLAQLVKRRITELTTMNMAPDPGIPQIKVPPSPDEKKLKENVGLKSTTVK